MVQVVKMGWAIIIIRVKMDRICSNNIMGVVSNSNSTRTRAKITTLIHKSKQTVVSIKVIIVLILIIIIIIINRKNHTKKRVIKETMTRKKS